MILFLSNQVRELREIGFQTEKEMQKFCEQNMDMLLGISIYGKRIPGGAISI